MTRAAQYLRVSSDRQDAANQELQVSALCTARGYTVHPKHVFRVVERGDAEKNDIKAACRDAARRGEIDAIVIWSLDRWTRSGIADLIGDVAQLRKWGCSIVSIQEPWADTTDEGMGDLMLAIAGWMGKQEKRRLSERNKATAQRIKVELASKGKLVSKRGRVYTQLGRRPVQLSAKAERLAMKLRATKGDRYTGKPTGWPTVVARIEAELGEVYAPATIARVFASKSGNLDGTAKGA